MTTRFYLPPDTSNPVMWISLSLNGMAVTYCADDLTPEMLESAADELRKRLAPIACPVMEPPIDPRKPVGAEWTPIPAPQADPEAWKKLICEPMEEAS